jgi:hypothetical protein
MAIIWAFPDTAPELISLMKDWQILKIGEEIGEEIED